CPSGGWTSLYGMGPPVFVPEGKNMRIRLVTGSFLMVFVAETAAIAQTPLGTAFTYQAQLKSNASPASGAFDFRFLLFDAPTGGAQIGPALCMDNSSVSNGLFTVSLD